MEARNALLNKGLADLAAAKKRGRVNPDDKDMQVATRDRTSLTFGLLNPLRFSVSKLKPHEP